VHDVDGERFECDGAASVMFSRGGKHLVDQIQHIIPNLFTVGVVDMPAAPTEDL